MKFSKFIFAGISALVLLSSCASNKLKGNEPVMATGTPEIIDYPGIALGKKVPEWVMAIDEGENKKVAKALGVDKKTKLVVITNKGNDLDFLKTWSDQVDARAEIASTIEQTIAQSVQSSFAGTDAAIQAKKREFNIYSAAMTNVTMNGLEKIASYWVKTRILKEGVKKAKLDSDYIIEYTYYVVYGIDKDIFERQVNAAIQDVEDNSDQSELLKLVLSEKLSESVIVKDYDYSFGF